MRSSAFEEGIEDLGDGGDGGKIRRRVSPDRPSLVHAAHVKLALPMRRDPGAAGLRVRGAISGSAIRAAWDQFVEDPPSQRGGLIPQRGQGLCGP